MTQLKCVGGPNDGQYWTVDNPRRIGEAIQTFVLPEQAVNFKEPLSATMNIHVYIIEKVGWQNHSWTFLRYEKTTLQEIMINLLGNAFS